MFHVEHFKICILKEKGCCTVSFRAAALFGTVKKIICHN